MRLPLAQVAKETKRIDLSSIPGLLKLAQEVRSTNEPCILQEESEDVAMLTPLKPRDKRSVRGKPVTTEDRFLRQPLSLTNQHVRLALRGLGC